MPASPTLSTCNDRRTAATNVSGVHGIIISLFLLSPRRIYTHPCLRCHLGMGQSRWNGDIAQSRQQGTYEKIGGGSDSTLHFEGGIGQPVSFCVCVSARVSSLMIYLSFTHSVI